MRLWRQSKRHSVAQHGLAVILAVLALACDAEPTVEASSPIEPPRIEAHGRLRLKTADLPKSGPLVILIEMSDGRQPHQRFPARVVSHDGRRLEAMVVSGSHDGTDSELRIDPAELTPGSYLIEVDSADDHPMNLRRFVLELHN